MDIRSMLPRCTSTDMDLQDALDSPKKETWILNHHKLRCLACLWSPSDTRQTRSPVFDNKSDFFFVTKYGNGLLPSNTFLTLCEECIMQAKNAWTSFPIIHPDCIMYRTQQWKLTPKGPPLHSLKRPIIVDGVRVLLDKKLEAKKTPPSKRLKLNNTVKRSPLSDLESNLNQIGFIIQHKLKNLPPKQPQP
jgi:hypothetical protein